MGVGLLAGACGQDNDTVDARTTETPTAETGRLGDAADRVGDRLSDLDLSGLTPQALRDHAENMVSNVSDKLGEIRDTESATRIRDELQPTIDKLAEIKGKLAAELPDSTTLSNAVADLKERFADQPAVMQVLTPLIAKIETLLG